MRMKHSGRILDRVRVRSSEVTRQLTDVDVPHRWVGLRVARLGIVRHRVDVVVTIGFQVGVKVKQVVGTITEQTVFPRNGRVAVAERVTPEAVLREAHPLAFDHGGRVQGVLDDTLVQPEAFAGLDGALFVAGAAYPLVAKVYPVRTMVRDDQGLRIVVRVFATSVAEDGIFVGVVLFVA